MTLKATMMTRPMNMLHLGLLALAACVEVAETYPFAMVSELSPDDNGPGRIAQGEALVSRSVSSAARGRQPYAAAGIRRDEGLRYVGLCVA
jgi:hypothetical protein